MALLGVLFYDGDAVHGDEAVVVDVVVNDDNVQSSPRGAIGDPQVANATSAIFPKMWT